MRALVTGVAGFVGSSLARRLLADGHEVVGIDSLTDYYDVEIKEANLRSIPQEGFSLFREDLNTFHMPTLLDAVDVVYHQSGQPGVRKSWGEDFQEYTTANISATQRLLEACRDASSVRRIVYASSSSVYGDAESFPTDESARPAPRSPYGVTKLAAEHLCVLYAKNFGLPTTSLRYFTVYGPGQRPDMAFTRFTKALVLDQEITLYGDGSQVRDFTYIDDVVNANILAGTAESAPGSVYNVAGGSNVSVSETLRTLEGISRRRFKINQLEAVPGDVFRTGGATHRIRTDLGWEPTVGIEQGLAMHYEWAVETFGGEE
jgi:UDP-glucuronate 4-epimerase